MNPILSFLSTPLTQLEQTSADSELDGLDLLKLNATFGKSLGIAKVSKLNPPIRGHQIWTVARSYLDYFGIQQISDHPMIVITTGDLDHISGEEFIRINVLSPFIEMAVDDHICHDSSIIGFPFLVEHWNGQPILSSILEDYLGYYEIPEQQEEYISIGSEHRSFREIELSNARYLNHSISSFISFIENKQSERVGISLSLRSDIFFPAALEKPSSDGSLAPLPMAARAKAKTDQQTYQFEHEDLSGKLLILPMNNTYSLTLTNSLFELYQGAKLIQSSLVSPGSTQYLDLKPGLYALVNVKLGLTFSLRLK